MPEGLSQAPGSSLLFYEISVENLDLDESQYNLQENVSFLF